MDLENASRTAFRIFHEHQRVELGPAHDLIDPGRASATLVTTAHAAMSRLSTLPSKASGPLAPGTAWLRPTEGEVRSPSLPRRPSANSPAVAVQRLLRLGSLRAGSQVIRAHGARRLNDNRP